MCAMIVSPTPPRKYWSELKNNFCYYSFNICLMVKYNKRRITFYLRKEVAIMIMASLWIIGLILIFTKEGHDFLRDMFD